MSIPTAGVVARPESVGAESAYPPRAPAVKQRRRFPDVGRWLSPIGLVLLWQAASSTGVLPPDKLASPVTVFRSGYELVVDGQLVDAFLVSLSRDTSAEAWREAEKLLEALDPAQVARAQEQLRTSQSVGQQRMVALHGGYLSRGVRGLEIHPGLWAGVGLVRGGAGTALVGGHAEVADLIEEYPRHRHRGVRVLRLPAPGGGLLVRRGRPPDPGPARPARGHWVSVPDSRELSDPFGSLSIGGS